MSVPVSNKKSLKFDNPDTGKLLPSLHEVARELDLADREAGLARREAELARREAELEAGRLRRVIEDLRGRLPESE